MRWAALGLVVIAGWFGPAAAAVGASGNDAGERAARSGQRSPKPPRLHWEFDRSMDRNFDRWPDGWQRRRGRRYPAYVSMEIAPHDPQLQRQLRAVDAGVLRFWPSLRERVSSLPELPPSVADLMTDRYLRVELDGGQAVAQSPPVPASRLHQYRFRCRVMTEGLRHDQARAELVFLDSSGSELSAHSTRSIGGTQGWTRLSVDGIRPPATAETLMVRLLVEGSEDGLEDIRGAIGFDKLVIESFPQLQVATDEPLGIYRAGDRIVAGATVMGVPAGPSQVRFRVRDHAGRQWASPWREVKPPQWPAAKKESDGLVPPEPNVTWKIPRLSPGFYRLRAELAHDSTRRLNSETTFAVIDTLVPGLPHGVFGWSLPERLRGPEGEELLGQREIGHRLAELGLAWVKYPCWLAPEDEEAAGRIARVLHRLQEAGLQTVGVLDAPPESQYPLYQLRGPSDAVAARLFRDLETWQPLLEPVMSRLTLQVRRWQLGADRDHSFLGRPRLRESVDEIAQGLRGYGQPIDISLSWPWLEPQLPPSESSWQAICRSSDPPLNAKELDAYLSQNPSPSGQKSPRTWLLLDPLPASEYQREDRIRDLVLRMATVRRHAVQAAFVSRPRDPEQGLLKESGRPAEMLLPWRTTARLIGDLRYAGSLQLRSGAENAVFAGDDRLVMIVWSTEPTEEKIYLGEDVAQIDVWGHRKKLPVDQDGPHARHHVSIGPTPSFLVGVDPMLMFFRMSVALEQQQLDSLLGQRQALSVQFANRTDKGLIGSIRVGGPQSWSIRNPVRPWELLADSSTSETFDVVLGNSATVGTHRLPIEFDFRTEPPQQITVYRDVVVGPKGLDLNITTRLDDNGELRVEIEMRNQFERARSYDCFLFPGDDRQYQRSLVTLQPGETVQRVFRCREGETLVGRKMLLRAAEREGPRVLNRIFTVRP